ncbi:MAG: UDP-glucose 4-epimerase GalE [Acidobacteriota bacterium]|nr:UDP-glucose 4-epimerase GalE [Acidobacteriota bacterium]
MRVLVVGGAGYIGSHVVMDLLDNGHEVTVFDNLSTGHEINLFEEAHFVKGDMLIEEDLEGVLNAGEYDAVIHLAALKAAGDSMTDPETYAHHNICGSINLLNAVTRHGIRKFVFSSTAAVFGDPRYLPVDENHPVDPANFYGFTKLQFERQLAWFDKLRGMKFVSLRYFNAAGYDPDLRVKGLEVNPKNLVPVVMEVAMGTRKELMVFGSDFETRDGTGIRDYIHVSDLASAHTKALDYLAGGGDSLAVNLGSESGHSVLEVVQCAREVTGREIPYKLVDRREGDPACLYATSQHAQKVLNWKPVQSDLKSMIATTWNAYINQ